MRLSFPVSARLRPLCAAIALGLSGLAHASTSGVVISQVYGGGGNNGATYKNDFVELFNAGSAPVSLNGWSVQYASATNTNWSVTLLGNITLQPGQYFLVQQAAGTGGTTALPTPDAIGTIAMSGTTGKVALVSGATALSNSSPTGSTIIDYVAFGPTATPFEGSGPAPVLSNTTAALRANGGCTDTNVNASDFATGAPTPRNRLSAVNVCAGGTTPTPTPTPGTLTPISQIQGTGNSSPKLGNTVNTSGVVTKVLNNGFYVQDPVGDSNPATSDGIFVFTSSAPTVQAGQAISLSGTVAEFNTGAASNALTVAHTVTQLTSPTNIVVSSSGNLISPTPITLPATEAQLEALEGMLVKINSQLTVSQNYFLGRYGQVTLSAEGRLVKPTNMFRPQSADAINLAARNAQRQILLDDGSSLQNPATTPYIGQDGTLRAGDTVDSLTGVIDYGLSTASNTGLASYKLHPTEAVSFARMAPRTQAPDAVGGNVKVASFNVLNFFTTFTNGATAFGQTGQGCTLGGASAAANCRGADNIEEFNRQRTKIVKALAALNADVVGLMEIQNNGNVAVQHLVDSLNAEVGTNTYASIALPSGSAATGTDAIRVAMIYKPGAVTPTGTPISDTNAVNNRPTLAQAFTVPNGEKFSVVVNHFKSKSCSGAGGVDADQQDGQGCYNATRQEQAARLLSFIEQVSNTVNDRDVLVIGDLNSYGKEDPIEALTNGGLNNLIERFNGNLGHSYVFDGEAGYLDHALASPSALPQVTGTVHWHINADEPSIIDYERDFKRPALTSPCYVSTQSSCSTDLYTATPFRSSDHDPVVIGLNLVKRLSGSARSETIVGTAGDDVITGGEGADTITSGAGRDVFVYNSTRDGTDAITDFTPGQDRVDLSAIASTLRAVPGTPADLLASGHIQLVNTAAGVQIRIDTDGSQGTTAVARPLVTLRGVTASQIVASRDLIL